MAVCCLALLFSCCWVCSSCLLLAVLFLTSCRSALSPAVGPLSPAAVALVTSCRSALVTSCRSALLASCLLDHPTLSLLTSREYSSVLLRLLGVVVCLSVTPCATLSWFSMNSLLADCSLAYRVLTQMLCVVRWTDQPSRTPPSCLGDQPEYGCERVSRVLLRRPGCTPAKASRAEIGAPALLPQPLLRWPCASWSVNTSRCRHARFD